MADDKQPVHSVSSRPSRIPQNFSLKGLGVRRERSKRVRSGLLALAFVATAVLGGIAGGAIESRSNSTSVLGGTLSDEQRIVSSQGQLINQISKSAGSSVVSIDVNVALSQPDPFGIFGEDRPTRQAAAAGTGIILNKDGLVVTNRHVVPEGTDDVDITLSDGTELADVTVIGRTNESDSLDIAFLKINDREGKTLNPAELGDSSKVQVGDDVVAIGNALGEFQNSVTSGIVSGFGRSVQAGSFSDPESLSNLIQTDAAINEGNSGGPLMNLNGQVIGINTAIAGGDAQNIGFAIPINDVKGLIEQVLETGKFERPYLGVRYLLIDPAVVDQYDLDVKNGAFVAPSEDEGQPSVLPGSPAARAGLKAGDIITNVDGDDIKGRATLITLLNNHRPGDKVDLTVIRDGKTQTIGVTLGIAPSN